MTDQIRTEYSTMVERLGIHILSEMIDHMAIPGEAQVETRPDNITRCPIYVLKLYPPDTEYPMEFPIDHELMKWLKKVIKDKKKENG